MLKVNTLAELVAGREGAARQAQLCGTPGLPVYVLLALQRYAGIEMANVPYRDFAPAYQDLNQGRLHVIGTGVPTQVAHHRAGTAKLLFVTNRERSPQVPDVPTAKEAGYPDLTFEGVAGVYGWRGMPAEIRQRVVADVAAIVADPDFRARVLKVGTVPRPGTPEEFAAAIDGAARAGRGHPCCDRKAQAAERCLSACRLPSLAAKAAGGNACVRSHCRALRLAAAVGVLGSLVLLAAPARRRRRRAGRSGRCASSSRSGPAPAPTSARG